MKKLILLILIVFTITYFNTTSVIGYNYSPWGNPIPSSYAYNVSRTVDNFNLVGLDNKIAPISFGDIRDVVYEYPYIYISDYLNNKVYILNTDYEYVSSIPNDSNEKSILSKPLGLFVKDDLLYVCDSSNLRVAIFSATSFEFVSEIVAPTDDIFLSTKTKFSPIRVAVDNSSRVLVIAANIFEGVMEFDKNGVFQRFYGTKQLTLGVFQALVYKLSTKEQKKKMTLNLQTSFTSIDIDNEGYLYTVSSSDSSPVQKINFKGKNVLIESGYIKVLGDSSYSIDSKDVPTGPSVLIDVAINKDNNKYSILDQKRGHVFTYDKEGNLLYINGSLGNQSNNLQGPMSITYLKDDILVVDNVTHSLLVFSPTYIGLEINYAIDSYYKEDYEESKLHFDNVIKKDSNYFLAYAGIGKYYYRQNDYEQAVKYFKLGYDTTNYSIAYKELRKQNLKNTLPYVLIAGFSILFIIMGVYLYRSIKRDDDNDK
jgi:hypothetical protein